MTNALKTLFFTIYALGSDDEFLMVPYQNEFTPFIGLLIFVVFHLVSINILISLLVAMLTVTFEETQVK